MAKLERGVNDLSTVSPEISAEWNYSKNGQLTPSDVTCGVHKRVWWVCQKGHEYQQEIPNRLIGQGCPYCSGNKVLQGFNDLATVYPDVAELWHPTKNDGLTPSDVTWGSGKKVWWLCHNGHEFQQKIIVQREWNSCPYCSGRKVLNGFNDLATVDPTLASEWHPKKNGDLRPNDVTAGSKKKVWWLCPKGHEFQASIGNRRQGTKCPVCDSVNKTSFPEQVVYFYIKQLFPDAVNKYRITSSTTMELDVYVPSLNLGIEFDGATWHKTKTQYVAEKKKYNICREKGIKLIRIKEKTDSEWRDVADEVYIIDRIRRDTTNLEGVIRYILDKLDVNSNLWTRKNPLQFHSEVLVDLKRDREKILSYLSERENSLAQKRPDLAANWDYEKNNPITPEMVTVSSGQLVWWKCAICGYEWQSTVNSLTCEGRKTCPKCSRRKLWVEGKYGTVGDNMPELVAEWHPTKNGDLTPFDIATGSSKRVWWLCQKCGHEWEMRPSARKSGRGCPKCRRESKRLLHKQNDSL